MYVNNDENFERLNKSFSAVDTALTAHSSTLINIWQDFIKSRLCRWKYLLEQVVRPELTHTAPYALSAFSCQNHDLICNKHVAMASTIPLPLIQLLQFDRLKLSRSLQLVWPPLYSAAQNFTLINERTL